MKKRYQIDREQAVGKFQEQAKRSEESLQLTLPLKEVAAALQEGVGRLMRDAGLELMQLVMDNEVRQLAGERYERRAPEQPYRWGREQGFLVVDGQKVPIERPRLRSEQGREQRLGSYELFRRSGPLDEAVWDKLMLGLSTRDYSKAVRTFAESYGIDKSAVSDHFVRLSREKLRQIVERPLDKLPLCVIYLDGIEFKGQHLVVALGVAVDGAKTVLGLRQGASENATVVGELLDDLVERGIDFSVPMLYVLDGSKALRKALLKHAGAHALLQRCQLHKRRNVTAHLPQSYRDRVERKMIGAYQMTHYGDAKETLEKLHRELMELNPSAARSLAEGMEETLTVHRLRIDGLLRLTLATTNPIESAFSTVDRICSRVKCWRRGDHRERWVGASLWLAERNFRRVKGYKQLPKLLAELAKLNTPPPAQAEAA